MNSRLVSVRIQSIAQFVRICSSAQQPRVDWINSTYSRLSSDLVSVVEFLNSIRVLTVNADIYYLEDSVKLEVGRVHDPTEVVSATINKQLLYGRTDYTKLLRQFLLIFNNVNGTLIASSEQLAIKQFAPLRDLLLQTHLLERSSKGVEVTPTYTEHVNGFLRGRQTLKSLKAKLANRERIGREAERLVVRYEQLRLEGHPHLQTLVRAISDDSVSAGYDIISFLIGSDGTRREIYIEVKAVSEPDFTFHWSLNEIRTARRLGSDYFLYLLPYFRRVPEIESLQVIRDPYTEVYMSRSTWKRVIDSYVFHPTEGMFLRI